MGLSNLCAPDTVRVLGMAKTTYAEEGGAIEERRGCLHSTSSHHFKRLRAQRRDMNRPVKCINVRRNGRAVHGGTWIKLLQPLVSIWRQETKLPTVADTTRTSVGLP